MKVTILSSLLAMTVMAPLSDAGNWAHWRGPTGNGVAPEAQPPVEWSSTKNVAWKTPIPGKGSGSPVVWENKIFVTSAVNTGRASQRSELPELAFKLFCFDRNTGKQLWEQTAIVATPHEGTHSTNGFASASPCTDGERVYAHFGSRGLYCYSIDGDLIWSREDLGKMSTRNGFGEGSSPTLTGEKIIVPWDHEGQSYIAALNKLTGKTIWKTVRDEPTCWSTPLIIEVDGQKQIIANGQNYARSYDLETGKELWRCGGQTERPAASPLFENGIVYIGSGHRGSFLGAFDPRGKGDIGRSKSVLWTIDRDTPDIASPLLSSGRIYFHKGKTGLLSCVDSKTGKPFYTASRINGLRSIYASPVAAGGHIYLTDRDGTTVVIKDAPELEVVATNQVGEGVDATPAPVDDQLFIRGEKHLFCIQN